MSAVSPASPPPARPAASTRPAAPAPWPGFSPLLPVVLPLVVAAIVLSLLFARAFPPAAGADAPAVRLTEVAAESGLRFNHQQDGAEAPTTLGGAVAVFDFNQDGAPDLFFVNGAPWPWEETLDKRLGRSGALFRNDGRGRFTDVTATAGLNVEMQGMAATAGDFDADGLVDLFVTCVGPNRLFRNLGHGRFEDVTEQAGLAGEENTWSTGAAWIDYDGDGLLDLIVLHYARWPQEVGLGQAFTIADIGRSYGAAVGFISSSPSVYRNLGGGRFAPVAGSAGLRDIDPETGRPVTQPLALAPVDADGDRRLDLLVTYHLAPPALFLNRGGVFQKAARAPDARQEGAGADFAVASALPQVSEADERFAALRAAGGWSAPGPTVALAARLGALPVDLDLNGRLELFSGEGALEPNINKFEEGRDFARTPAVYWRSGREWRPLPGRDSDALLLPRLTARGLATADFDADGDPDIVVAQNNGSPVLLRNDQRLGLPWLRLRLIATRSHPEAGGARIEVHTPRRIMAETVAPALSFLGQSESTLSFGLGDDARVRQIVIRWPSGQVQTVKPGALNRTLEIREP